MNQSTEATSLRNLCYVSVTLIYRFGGRKNGRGDEFCPSDRGRGDYKDASGMTGNVQSPASLPPPRPFYFTVPSVTQRHVLLNIHANKTFCMNGRGHNDTSHLANIFVQSWSARIERIKRQRTSNWPLAEFLSRVAHFFPAALSVPKTGLCAERERGKEGASEGALSTCRNITPDSLDGERAVAVGRARENY